MTAFTIAISIAFGSTVYLCWEWLRTRDRQALIETAIDVAGGITFTLVATVPYLAGRY